MEIVKVEVLKNISDNIITGYLVNEKKLVTLDDSTLIKDIEEWLSKGNKLTEPYTKQERERYLENKRIYEINNYTQSFIYSKYSQPKQSSANLGVYDEAYKNEMVAFIKRVVDLSNEAIDNGISFEDYKIILEGGN